MIEIWNQLTKEIKEHDTIVIMAHQNIDYDALGSSLCLYEIVKSFNKDVFIFLDQDIDKMDFSIQKAFSRSNDLGVSYLYPNHYKSYLKGNPLLIVVDTNREDRIAYPHILNEIRDVALIDHHIKGQHYIKNTIITYINSGLSSIVEFMVHYAKYLNKEIPPIVSTIMLAGISIDTNEYRMKTTELTYEASALLMQMGADNIQKLEFMRESKEEYLKRLDFVKKSDIVKDGISFCIMDQSIVQARDLAIVSESLLQFDEINAAFTLGKLDQNTVGISARSIGTVNVQEIMESLGGGGHYSEAACQLKNVTLEAAKEKLLEKLG